jgi:glutathione S-transferase
MRLYHVPGSRSTRVLWTLEEIGQPYELTVLGRERLADSDPHRQRHPLGRVPVIELDDGRHLFESGAICLYLADLHPEAQLIPALATTERGLVYQWTVFAMSELEPKFFDWRFAERRGKDEGTARAAFEPVAVAIRDAVTRAEWIAGETFTVADVMCASILAKIADYDLGPDFAPLRAYVERALARPAKLRAEAVVDQ